MSTLLEAREQLMSAEKDYKQSSCMLDGNSVDLILAKENLKKARFDYLSQCEEYVEEVLAAGDLK